MRRCIVLLAIGCLLSAVFGQMYESTIYLPTTTHGYPMLYIADVGKVYLGDVENRVVVVISGAVNAVKHRIQLPLRKRGPINLCYNSVNRKLYCPDTCTRGVMAVIDVIEDSVVAVVESTWGVMDLRWSPIHNKVYCLESGDDSADVLVIDGPSDTIEERIRLPMGSTALCYNTTNDKLYCCHDYDSTVTVIDCGTNQILHTVGVLTHPEVTCYNPQQNRVYVATWCCNSLAVLDGQSDEKLARMSLTDPWCMLFDTTHNELYVSSGSSSTITVIGGSSNQVEHQIDAGTCPGPMCLDERAEHLYCTLYYDSMAVIDCSTHAISRTFYIGDRHGSIARNPDYQRTYVVCNDSHCIRVFRDSLNAVAEMSKSCVARTGATVVRGALLLPACPVTIHSSLFDMTGRRVMSLRPGPNDVSRLSPGVYFMREPRVEARTQVTRKVIIAR
jgi:YVTN family beta-propeller protein